MSKSEQRKISFLQLPLGFPERLTVLVLLADTPLPPVLEKHGSYHDIFTTLFRNSLHAAQQDQNWDKEGQNLHAIFTTPQKTKPASNARELTVESFDVVKGEYPDEHRIIDADAIIITGSAASSYAEESWIRELESFVKRAPTINEKVKLIGICFGHQVITQAFGGKVEKNPKGWEVGVHQVRMTELGKEVSEGKDVLRVQQMHQDIVVVPPEGFECLGSSDICQYHGFIRRKDPSKPANKENIDILTTQGHPEFTDDIVDKVVKVRKERGVFDDAFATDASKRAHEAHDGLFMGRQILRLLGF